MLGASNGREKMTTAAYWKDQWRTANKLPNPFMELEVKSKPVKKQTKNKSKKAKKKV